MIIEKFTHNDIAEATELTLSAWSDALREWKRDVARVVCEYSVRDEFLNEELALKITDDGVMKGFILAASVTDGNTADEWLYEQMKNFSDENDIKIFNMVIDASHGNESHVLNHMGEKDAMLTFFLSSQKGCGKILLQEMLGLLHSKGYENCYLWTDVTCNHEYYPKHGFTLVEEIVMHEGGDDGDTPFVVYIYRKKI